MRTDRPIVLVEFGALVPQPPTYATWTAAGLTAGLQLSDGDRTVTRISGGGSGWKGVRSNLSFYGGRWYWETVHNFAASGASQAAGVARGDWSVLTRLGFNTPSDVSGPYHNNGKCYRSSAEVATATTYATGTVIRHRVDFDVGRYEVALNAGAWIALDTIVDAALGGSNDVRSAPSAKLWAVAASLLDVGESITLRSDPADFFYLVPDGYRAGVFFSNPPTQQPIRLASEGWMSGPGDATPNTYWQGRLDPEQDLLLEEQATAWVWAGGGGSSALGAISVIHPDRELAAWKDYQFRDQRLTILRLFAGQARSEARTLSVALIDRLDPTESGFRIVLRGLDSLLDRPLQPQLYAEGEALPELVMQPKPVAFGLVRNCPPVLVEGDTSAAIDAAGRIYDVADEPIREITSILDSGDPFDPPPTDWTYVGAGRQRFKLRNRPAGPVTADLLGPYVVMRTLISRTGEGSFDDWSAADTPEGWTSFIDTGCALVEAPAGSARFDVITKKYAEILAIVPMVEGGRYRVKASVAAGGDFVFNVFTGSTFAGQLVGGDSEFEFVLAEETENFRVLNEEDSSGRATLEWISLEAISVVERLPSVIQWALRKSGLDTELSLNSGIVGALDFVAPYPLAFWSNKPITVDQLLRRVMDSFCGAYWVDALSRICVGRLADPSSAASFDLSPDDILDVEIVADMDEARGLTTRMAGAKNNAPISQFAGAVPLQVRSALSEEFPIVRRAPSDPAATYAHASRAAAVETLISDDRAAEREVARVSSLFRVSRTLFSVTVSAESFDFSAHPLFSSGRVRADFDRLTGGLPVVLVGKQMSALGQSVVLRVWG